MTGERRPRGSGPQAEDTPARAELEGLLRRLEDARAALLDALKGADRSRFQEVNEGESLKRMLERTADDVNFYYGRLVSRAMSLPQPPCLIKADFSSLREAAAAIAVTHQRFSNTLHDLRPEDLQREATDPELGTFTMRQILEMLTAHYALRTQQVASLAGGQAAPPPEGAS